MIPSRRHRSFTVTSRRNPSKTMRIFSSGVYLRRVAALTMRTKERTGSFLRPHGNSALNLFFLFQFTFFLWSLFCTFLLFLFDFISSTTLIAHYFFSFESEPSDLPRFKPNGVIGLILGVLGPSSTLTTSPASSFNLLVASLKHRSY